MSKKTIRLTESDLYNIINESVKKVLNEIDYYGSSSIISVLENNGVNHTLASAIEGAITYVAKIDNYELLGDMAKYIQDAVDDEHATWSNKEDIYNV